MEHWEVMRSIVVVIYKEIYNNPKLCTSHHQATTITSVADHTGDKYFIDGRLAPQLLTRYIGNQENRDYNAI